MSYFLIDNVNPNTVGPNGKPHFYLRRNRPVLAIVIHVTAGLEGLAGVEDLSAEQTARYAATTDRQVSWHSGSDTDTAIQLLPASATALHVKGYNSSTYGHEISKRNTNWLTASPQWVADTLANAAEHLRAAASDHRIPARRCSKEELDDAIATFDRSGKTQPVGFIGHHELDPTRRTDPGLVGDVDTFPWANFLKRVIGKPTSAPLEDEMALIVRNAAGKALLTDLLWSRPINADQRVELRAAGVQERTDDELYEYALAQPRPKAG